MTTATILVADDDPVTLGVLTVSLQHERYSVVTAVDALQAVMMAHRRAPNAIVLDVMMPAGSGLEVLKRLKASSETREIPVIAISSSKDATLPAKATALGAAVFLPKPVDLVELNGVLRRLVGDASRS